MQISRKADYAIRAMAILASLGEERSMQAQELAGEGRIPTKFLEQILLSMKRAGLLRSKRGVGGGYRLGRESRLITLADVIEAVDGELVHLVDENELPTFSNSPGVLHYLRETERGVNDALAAVTLEDIARHDAGDALVGYGI